MSTAIHGQTNSGDQIFLGTATVKAVIQMISMATLPRQNGPWSTMDYHGLPWLAMNSYNRLTSSLVDTRGHTLTLACFSEQMMASCLSGVVWRSQLISDDRVGDIRAAVRMLDIDCCPDETTPTLAINSEHKGRYVFTQNVLKSITFYNSLPGILVASTPS